MTIEDIISNLANVDATLTICAARSPNWTPASEAVLCPAATSHKCHLPYFLEVSVARDILRAWSFVRGSRKPNLASQCEAIIYYAENDAYLQPNSQEKSITDFNSQGT